MTGIVPLILFLALDPPSQDRQPEVLKAEQARLEARAATDSAAAARLMSSDFLQVDRLGHLLTKDEVLKNYGLGITSIRDTDVHVFDDVAVVTGIGKGPKKELRFLHLWRRENRSWVATFVQNTIIDPTVSGLELAASGWPDGATREERDVINAQRALAKAAAARDARMVHRLTAAGFVRVSAGGEVVGSDLPKAPPATSKVSDCRLRVDGQVAFLLCRDNAPSRVTTVFVKQNGKWKQFVAQVTPLSTP